MAVQSVAATQDGRLAQLVRALPSHGRGQRFKSFVAHHSFSFSHHRSGTCSCRAAFVLNLLFRSKWKQGFEPLPDSRLECDAVVGAGAAGFDIGFRHLRISCSSQHLFHLLVEGELPVVRLNNYDGASLQGCGIVQSISPLPLRPVGVAPAVAELRTETCQPGALPWGEPRAVAGDVWRQALRFSMEPFWFKRSGLV